MGGSPLSADGCSKSSVSSEDYYTRRAAMLISNSIVLFQASSFHVDATALMDLASSRLVRMDQVRKTLKCCQIPSLMSFVRNFNYNLLDWCKRNQSKYFLETRDTDKWKGEGSYSQEPRGTGFSGYKGHRRFTCRGLG